MRAFSVLFGAAFVLMSQLAAQQSGADRFEARMYRAANGKEMPYRLFIPKSYDKQQKYPAVIWLHGIDAVGNDNRKQISDYNYAGSNVWTYPNNQEKYPSFVIAPQLPQGAVWATPLTRSPTEELLRVVDILRVVQREYSIDENRIYLVGQSLGGFGTWSLLGARPELFAAAVPVCGGGNVTKAKEIAKVPIWAYHAVDDPIVLVFESKAMVTAVQKAGGNIKYIEYKGGLHNAWDRAFHDPEMIEWLFSQSRAKR